MTTDDHTRGTLRADRPTEALPGTVTKVHAGEGSRDVRPDRPAARSFHAARHVGNPSGATGSQPMRV